MPNPPDKKDDKDTDPYAWQEKCASCGRVRIIVGIGPKPLRVGRDIRPPYQCLDCEEQLAKLKKKP